MDGSRDLADGTIPVPACSPTGLVDEYCPNSGFVPGEDIDVNLNQYPSCGCPARARRACDEKQGQNERERHHSHLEPPSVKNDEPSHLRSAGAYPCEIDAGLGSDSSPIPRDDSRSHTTDDPDDVNLASADIEHV